MKFSFARDCTELHFHVLVDKLVDAFSDLPFPPFEEEIHYRLVAMREIENELGLKELIPSIPSDILTTRLIDNINPETPKLLFSSALISSSSPATYFNSKLIWEKTTHNGKYHIFKMNNKGNWMKIGEVISNNVNVFRYGKSFSISCID